jgi:hypothetical protein
MSAAAKAGNAVAGRDIPASLAAVRHLARHQVMGLVSVFLLGMAVNLTGLPAQTSSLSSYSAAVGWSPRQSANRQPSQ